MICRLRFSTNCGFFTIDGIRLGPRLIWAFLLHRQSTPGVSPGPTVAEWTDATAPDPDPCGRWEIPSDPGGGGATPLQPSPPPPGEGGNGGGPPTAVRAA